VAGQTPESLGVVGRYDSASLGRPQLDMNWTGAALNARWDVGGVAITSISAWDQLEYGRFTDLDSIPTTQLHIDYQSDIEVLAQSLRAAFSPLQSVDVLLGVDLSRDTLRENTDLVTTDGLLPFAFRVTRLLQPYEQETQSWAAFTRLDYAITQTVSVAAEARYTEDEKSFVGGVFIPASGSFISPRTGESLFIDADRTFSAWTGKLILQYEPGDDVMLYASLARGFKTGGFFGGHVTAAAQLQPYDNEYIDAVEVGWKSEWLDRRLRVNMAAFYYEREGIQANGSRREDSGVNLDRLTNVGDGETTGFETEILWAPTQALLAGVSAGYTDSEIVASDFVVQSIFGGEPRSPVGARLPNQPEFSANGFVRYARQLQSGLRWSVRADYAYQSEMDLDLAVTAAERAFLREDPYGILDLSYRLESGDGAWSAGVFVNNVTQEEYRIVARDITSGGLYEIWGAPRTWGISVSRRW
jgi:iron complex outermembrane receptor protein